MSLLRCAWNVTGVESIIVKWQNVEPRRPYLKVIRISKNSPGKGFINILVLEENLFMWNSDDMYFSALSVAQFHLAIMTALNLGIYSINDTEVSCRSNFSELHSYSVGLESKAIGT